MKKTLASIVVLAFLGFGCHKENHTTSEKVLRFKLKFDPDQIRLDNLGNPSGELPANHAAQTPDFHAMSAHFIELVPDEFTAYKAGAFVYKGEEVPAYNPNPFNFTTAIDFERAIVVDEGEVFLEVPISEVAAGTYRHIRVSVTYQNYDVKYNLLNLPIIGQLNQQNGTVASFVGYNTYIEKLRIRDKEIDVSDFKLQGFWGFETNLNAPYSAYNQISSGQAPTNSTTVVNPFPNAPIPQGSCVVSGSFEQPLVITGQEKEAIEITLSMSINKSFEWEDLNGNGEWDIDAQAPANSEPVVDMGLRGLKALVD